MSTAPSPADLLVLAKEPRAGQVKTRLAPALGAEGAATLHTALVTDILRRAVARHPHVTLCVTPPDDTPTLTALARQLACDITPQCDGHLGQRMAHALYTSLTSRRQPTLLIGSDSPTLPDALLEQAAEQLATTPLVLGPSVDGGYYLVGAHPSILPRWQVVKEALFGDLPWGSDTVLQHSLQRAYQAGLPVALAPCWYDVDRPQDLTLLRRHLSADSPVAVTLDRLVA